MGEKKNSGDPLGWVKGNDGRGQREMIVFKKWSRRGGVKLVESDQP